MENKTIKNFGYIEREITEDNYILGGLLSAPFEILQENGQWLDFLPENEEQRKESFDTMGCTQYATLNALEILIKRKFGEVKNYSERYIGVIAENSPTGNDPHNIAEAIRHYGNLDDYYLPFSENLDSFEEYYAPKPMTKHYLDIGIKWLKEYDFKHEYVFGNFTSLKDKQIKIMEALKSSPVGVSVVAWIERNGLYYKPEGMKDNHWTICIGYKENEYWIIYDSYDGYIKKLEWNYDFGRAKRYWLEKKKEFIQLSIIEKILALMSQVVNLFWEKKKEEIKIEVKLPEPIRVSRIKDFALAIQEMEGYFPGSKSYRNNNPGNIKRTDGSFIKYDTYEIGFSALCNYLTRACNGQHPAYPKGGEMTLLEFTMIYAPKNDNNEPIIYANFIASQLSVNTTIKIKELL